MGRAINQAKRLGPREWLLALPSAVLMVSSAEEQLIAALQRRLKVQKREVVCAAVALVRDPTLSIAAACDSQNPKVARGSRDRVKGYCERIKNEGLLIACAPVPAQSLLLPAPLLGPQQPSWIEAPILTCSSRAALAAARAASSR